MVTNTAKLYNHTIPNKGSQVIDLPAGGGSTQNEDLCQNALFDAKTLKSMGSSYCSFAHLKLQNEDLQNLMSLNGVGGGINRKGGLITKKRLSNRGLIREEKGGRSTVRWGLIEILQ